MRHDEMNEEMAIVARGLTKRYKNTTAVDNLDLDIPRGAIYGFLGPNGAGKTTTIRMLLGLVKPTSGSARVLGYDIERERGAIAAKLGAIVEVPAFYTYLTGFENLRVLANSSNLSINDRDIAALIDRVGLDGRGKHAVKTYSLGMKQRLGIAATLLSNPEILFLDEPTNGLDPVGTVEMRKLIGQLGAAGHTIFLSSHLLDEVEKVCTDVIIVQQGVKRLQGRMAELMGAGNGYAIKASPGEAAFTVLRRYPELNVQLEAEGWLRIDAAADDIPRLVRALVIDNIDVYEIEQRRNSLEKLFLELTGKPVEKTAPSGAAVEVMI